MFAGKCKNNNGILNDIFLLDNLDTPTAVPLAAMP